MKDTSFEAYIADQAMIGRIKESIKKEERNRVIDKVEKYLKEHIIFVCSYDNIRPTRGMVQ